MYNKFKFISIFILSLASGAGCHGELEPIDYSDINPSIFPQTEEDLNSMVLSCYHPLRSDWWDGINSFSERGVMLPNDCCTEIITQEWDIMLSCSNMSFNETTSNLTYFYYTRNEPYGFHSKISRCTLVKDAIDNSVLSESLKNRYNAEVRCARAFLSYILFDMFGPLVVAPIEVLKSPLKEQPLPRLSNDEMVKFIEDDLLFAAEYLPGPREAEYGRFSKGLAKMLLIRLYLHQSPRDKSYYNKVEELAREMMAPSFGYALSASYPSLFELRGMNSQNKEYIYIIPCNYEGTSVNHWHREVLPGDYPGLSGWHMARCTWWFYDTFEAEDTRKTYIITEYTNAQGETFDRVNSGGISYFHLGPIPSKYEIDFNANRYDGHSDLDCVIYRYADVLLSLAEAIVMKPGGGVNAEAVELLNTIRRRAGLQNKVWTTDPPSQQEFIDQLLTERSHEFWCENGQYRADLIRHDKLLDRVLELNNNNAPFASKDKYLYPLPLSVIVDGKGLVLQNPGYSQ